MSIGAPTPPKALKSWSIAMSRSRSLSRSAALPSASRNEAPSLRSWRKVETKLLPASAASERPSFVVSSSLLNVASASVEESIFAGGGGTSGGGSSGFGLVTSRRSSFAARFGRLIGRPRLASAPA